MVRDNSPCLGLLADPDVQVSTNKDSAVGACHDDPPPRAAEGIAPCDGSAGPEQDSRCRSLCDRLRRWWGKSEPCMSWVVLVCVTISFIAFLLPDFIVAICYHEISDLFGVSMQDVGWMYSIYTLFSLGTAIGFSAPVTHFGCRSVALLGFTVTTAFLTLSAFAPNFIIFTLLFAVVAAPGRGLILLCGSVIIQQHFHHNRGLATGFSALGFSLTNIVNPLIINYLVDKYGFRGGLLICAGVFAQTLILAAMYFPAPSPPPAACAPPPESTQPRLGQTTCLNKINRSLGLYLLKDVKYLMLWFSVFFTYMMFRTVYIQGVNRLREVGLTSGSTAYVFSIIGVCNIIVRCVLTLLMNFTWFNEVLANIFGNVLGVISMMIFSFRISYPMALGASVLFGMYEGAMNSIRFLLVVRLVGTQHMSQGVGLIMLAGLPSVLLSAPLSGWSYDTYGTYQYSFMMAATMGLISTGFLVFIEILRRVEARKNKTKAVISPKL